MSSDTQQLYRRLSSLPPIADLSGPEHDEAAEMAFHLGELRRVSEEMIEWFPRFGDINRMDETEILDALFDFGELLRRLVSNAHEMRFFEIYLEPLE